MIYVDPGKHLLGYAVTGISGVVRGPDRAQKLLARFPAVRSLCVEQMFNYPRAQGSPNDLIPLTFLAGELYGLRDWDEFLYPKAREWKGSVPKKVHHARMLRDNPWIKTKDTDELDAIGLWFWGSGFKVHAQIPWQFCQDF